MNFQGNFRKLGDLDPKLIKAFVDLMPQTDWTREVTRQKKFEVHKDTQTIGLVYDQDFRHMNGTRCPDFDLFKLALNPVFANIAEYYETSPEMLITFNEPVQGYFIRVTLVKLLAGGEITEHRDMGFSLTHSHRVHVPIITNDDVLFTIGSETTNLKQGGIYEINNRRLHSVVNKSDSDRVHLILDWVFPWEPCCCSATVHPTEQCTPKTCLEIYTQVEQCDCFPEQG